MYKQLTFKYLKKNIAMTQSFRFISPFHWVRRIILSGLFLALSVSPWKAQAQVQTEKMSVTMKPWTRWWWHGSAVTKEGITENLEALVKGGFGGVEVTPIFGVHGYEKQFIPYLSPTWMEMLAHTLREAKRLGLGVDMATGTGWPFGGPWIEADACKNMVFKTYVLEGGKKLTEEITYEQEGFVRSTGSQFYDPGDYAPAPMEANPSKPPAKGVELDALKEPISSNADLQSLALDQVRFKKKLNLAALMAYSNSGEVVNVMPHVDGTEHLNWSPPQGKWTIYAVFQGWHGKMVERAAPGGEGNVIDHFSAQAIGNYLKHFDKAFQGQDLSYLRAFFNDSYEVDDARGTANFTPSLFDEFSKRRHYDLRAHLPALFGQDEVEKNARVLCDYRETIGELVLEHFTLPWKTWAGKQGKIIRNQSHGSPANILDLYAASDIPETEGTDPLRIRMATSAAHVEGKKLVSSESATWLNEHFISTLGDIKQNVDRYWVNGVNHIVYHGTAYSPPGEKWPGWLFYASEHVNPRNTLWPGFPVLNAYIARVQQPLQESSQDHDVLLYLPAYDRYSAPGKELIEHFDHPDRQFEGTPFKECATMMVSKGYSFDMVSDRQLLNSTTKEGKIATTGSTYKTIVLPQCRYIPEKTMAHIMGLVEAGATLLIYKALPRDVPGLHDLEGRRKTFQALLQKINWGQSHEAKVGKGRILMGDGLETLLAQAGITREGMVDEGLTFTRRKKGEQYVYVVANWSGKAVERWVTLGRKGNAVEMMDPMTGKEGLGQVKVGQGGLAQVYVSLLHGQTLVMKLLPSSSRKERYPYWMESGKPQALAGEWDVQFLEGGPVMPGAYKTKQVGCWTGQGGEAYQQFSGTAEYSLVFAQPKEKAVGWVLDLGKVHDLGMVYLNGEKIGELTGPVFRVYIDAKKWKAQNRLVIRVSNRMANRIIAMDRGNVLWKKFYNVNFPARNAENRKNGIFNASAWDYFPSGLEGPVTLAPVVRMKF